MMGQNMGQPMQSDAIAPPQTPVNPNTVPGGPSQMVTPGPAMPGQPMAEALAATDQAAQAQTAAAATQAAAAMSAAATQAAAAAARQRYGHG